MKWKHIIVVFLALSICLIPSVNEIFAGSLSMQQFDKSTMVKKKLADAQRYIDNGDYVAAQNTLISLLRLDPNNSRAIELLDECESGIEIQKQQIHQAFIDACNAGSISSLENFISKYPNSEYVQDARIRIEDYNMWEKAKEQNTISAYNAYLSNSSILAYKEDANKAIRMIQAEIEWNSCKNSNDEYKLNAFIQHYSFSQYVSQAKYRLNILKGERYYSLNNFTYAYIYLKDADSYKTLSGLPAQHFKEITDKREFENIIASSDVAKIKRYLSGLPANSPYFLPTSNRIAVLLASSLSTYSSEYSMNEAMSYAKDDNTKTSVKNYISKVKKNRAYYERQRKIAARKAWWENRFMIGWNVFHFDYLDDVMTVGTGVKFRFGRWSDAVNLLFGAEYSYLMYLDGEANYYWEDSSVLTIAHAAEVPVGLRFNLFKSGRYSKFYVGCNAVWGVNISEGKYFYLNKQTLSIEPQLGFASKKLDFGIYYKKYLKSQELFKYTDKYSQRIGCFFTWFI